VTSRIYQINIEHGGFIGDAMFVSVSARNDKFYTNEKRITVFQKRKIIL